LLHLYLLNGKQEPPGVAAQRSLVMGVVSYAAGYQQTGYDGKYRREAALQPGKV